MSKRTLVILAHPNLASSKVNSRWVRELEKHGVTVRDLYQQYPDFNIDVAAEQNLVEQHDRIIFQFPLYWFSVPALLKHWMDQVLTYGWAYGPGTGKLKGKEFGVALSAGGPQSAYQAGGSNAFTISEFLRPIQQSIEFVGGTYLPAFTALGVMSQRFGPEELERTARDYAAYATGVAAHSAAA